MTFGWWQSNFALVLALSLLGATPRGTAERLDEHIRAVSLVKAAYPSLANQGLVFKVSQHRWRGFDDPMTQPSELLVAVGKRSADGSVSPVLSVLVVFKADETLYDLRAVQSDAFLNGQRIEALGKMIEEHQDWSAKDVAAATSAAGARFGPEQRADLERELDAQFRRIETVLGRIRRESPYFATDDRAPMWQVRLTAQTLAGPRRYQATFEPFEGKLRALTGMGQD